jgi:hypothetical protein
MESSNYTAGEVEFAFSDVRLFQSQASPGRCGRWLTLSSLLGSSHSSVLSFTSPALLMNIPFFGSTSLLSRKSNSTFCAEQKENCEVS